MTTPTPESEALMHFGVTIEIPRGSGNKYEVDHATGRLRLDRMLFTATRYPRDYGFIEDTLGQDGDPLDVAERLMNVVRGLFAVMRPVIEQHQHSRAEHRNGGRLEMQRTRQHECDHHGG